MSVQNGVYHMCLDYFTFFAMSSCEVVEKIPWVNSKRKMYETSRPNTKGYYF